MPKVIYVNEELKKDEKYPVFWWQTFLPKGQPDVTYTDEEILKRVNKYNVKALTNINADWVLFDAFGDVFVKKELLNDDTIIKFTVYQKNF